MRSLTLANVALLGSYVSGVHAVAGSGTSTRYWDCCKPSCSWPDKADVSQPVWSCNANGGIIADPNTLSGCNSGTAYTCNTQQPWALNNLVSYGFAATALSGETEADWCCGCYALTFTSGKAIGKIFVVQSINTGGDLGSNQFDLQIPGGGEGIFDGCTSEFGGIPGAQYGGISNRSQCEEMPAVLQPGCFWRFDWFNNADNPTHTFTQVQCPAELVNKTGCTRADDATFPKFTMPAVTTWNPPKPTATAAPFGQCDSLIWDVAELCPSGYTCTYVTDYYWQCVPGATSTSAAKPVATTTAVPGSPPATGTSGAVAEWGQCGPTPLPCQPGLKCVFVNDFYSQCQPA